MLRFRSRLGMGAAVLAALAVALGFQAGTPPVTRAATVTPYFGIYMQYGQTPTDGVPLAMHVVAFESDGTNDDCYGSTIHFSDSGTTVPADYTFNNTLCIVDLGDVGMHDFVMTPNTVGDHTLTITQVGNPAMKGTFSYFVQPGPATHFSLTAEGGSNATAGNPKLFTLQALDLNGYRATSYSGVMTVTSSDSEASFLPSYTFAPGDYGIRIFPVTFQTTGPQTLFAIDTAHPAFQVTANVTVGASPYFEVDVQDGLEAGQWAGYTVCARNADGTPFTSYTGTVHFTISDHRSQASAPSDYTISDSATYHGCFTSGATDLKFVTGGVQSMTVTDSVNDNFTGTGYTNVFGASGHSVQLSGLPSSVVAGPNSLTVVAFDIYGNRAGSAGLVFTSTDTAASLPATTYLNRSDNGQRTFNLTLATAGDTTVTVREMHVGSTSSSVTTHVYPGAATQLAVTGITSPTGAGTPITTTVAARDAYGNLDPSYRGTVHFTSTDTKAVLPADYTFTSSDAGSHTFTSGVTLKTAGKQAVRARDTVTSTITGLASNIAVAPGPLAAFALGGLTSPRTAGVAGTVGVKAVDAYGNTITGYTGTVHFTSTDLQAVLPADYTFVPGDLGVHGFSVTLKTAGLQAVRARDTVTSSVTGLQQRITVNPAAAAVLVVSGIADPYTAGVTDAFTVTAKDAYGNTATGYTGTVVFTSTDTAAVLPGAYTFVAADRGVHSFSLTLNTLGEQAVRARDTVTASITGLVKGITVTH